MYKVITTSQPPMMFTPLTDQQKQYYEQQDALWRAYVKRCCDRNNLSFLTYAEWLSIHDANGDPYNIDDERFDCSSSKPAGFDDWT